MSAFILIMGVLLYFFPSFQAASRHHKNAASIFIINLFFGWTLVVWIICLAWSCSSNVDEIVSKSRNQSPYLSAAEIRAINRQADKELDEFIKSRHMDESASE